MRAALEPGEPIAPGDLSVSSTRVGWVPGTHTVTFSSSSDEIELTHRALNRTGFAEGALHAAAWVQGREGLFTAEDVFFAKQDRH
jgi:4-hydroxy-tetrahydrodipicolinate reductase